MKNGRKPNFFERKRFLNYEKNETDSEEEKGTKNDKKETVTKEIKDGKMVESKDKAAKPADVADIQLEEVVVSKPGRKSKPQEVRSAAPPKKDDKKDLDLAGKKKSSDPKAK